MKQAILAALLISMVSSAYAGIAFFKREQTSGMNKICFYDHLGSEVAITIKSIEDLVDHLREARERLAAAGVDAELIWGVGEPGSVIVDTAKRIRASAIVLGEHHHGFLSGLFGADVDAEVRSQADCDVILV